jgi:hypothetical protein
MSSNALWVQIELDGKEFTEQVSFEPGQSVSLFKKRIKAEFAKTLAAYDAAQLTLYHLKDGQETEIDVGDSPADYVKGNSRKNPLIVKATAIRKTSRQMSTRKMSVEASCRKYLDALAAKLFTYYDFDPKSSLGPTIGDVFAAIEPSKKNTKEPSKEDTQEETKEGSRKTDRKSQRRRRKGKSEEDKKPRWSYRRYKNTYEQTDAYGHTVQINAGDPLHPIPLPELFTADEWEKLRKLNKTTNTRVHDASLPLTSRGKPYVIIPHSEFTEEMVSFLKSVGVKATLFSSPDDLEVKDEDALSEGSLIV